MNTNTLLSSLTSDSLEVLILGWLARKVLHEASDL